MLSSKVPALRPSRIFHCLLPALTIAALTHAPTTHAQWESQHDDRVVVWRTRLPLDAALSLATSLLPYPELVARTDPQSVRHFFYDRHGTNVFSDTSTTVAETPGQVTLAGLTVPIVSWEKIQILRHSEYAFERRRSKGIRTANLILSEKDYIESGISAETARRSEFVTVDSQGRPVSSHLLQIGAGTTDPVLDLVLQSTRTSGLRVWRLVVPGTIQTPSPSETYVPPSAAADRPFAPNEHVWYQVDAATLELKRLGLPSIAGNSVTLLLEGSSRADGPYEPRQWIRDSKTSDPTTFYRLRPASPE